MEPFLSHLALALAVPSALALACYRVPYHEILVAHFEEKRREMVDLATLARGSCSAPIDENWPEQ